MNHTRTFTRFCLVAGLVFVLTGCVSPTDNAARRREQLLAIYPPGKATRMDVQQKWSPVRPDLSETRPTSGWSAAANPAVRERTLASEQRTGKTVARCERYFGPDGLSGGLCYCWFYFDDRDVVLDAEWQWHTD
jgi:hypothetical protein